MGYAQAGDVPGVRRLLEQGVDPNHRSTRGGATPLLVAIQQDHGEVVHMLVENGANPQGVMVHKGITYDGLHLASSWGSIDAVHALLDSGIAVDCLDSQGKAALHLAALKGSVPVAILLLNYGATIDLSTTNHLTALYIAARNGHSGVVGLLLAGGAEVDKRNVNSLTAMMGAALANSGVTIQMLADYGADVNAAHFHGHTSLHLAALYGHQRAMEVLLLNGANKSTVVDGESLTDFLCKCTSQVVRYTFCQVTACDSPQAMLDLLS